MRPEKFAQSRLQGSCLFQLAGLFEQEGFHLSNGCMEGA
jgi:hypothetical protein